MSLSPLESGDPDGDYRGGWKAINRLTRQGWSWSGNERNCAYLNTADGGFARVDAVSGLDHIDDGRAACSVDWDGDGDLDLLVVNRTAPRFRYLRHEGESAPSLALKLEGTRSNRDAVGARVVLRFADGSERIATRRAGEGFLAQRGAWLHFGLGEGTPESVRVRWPDGSLEAFRGLRAGGRFELVEGSGAALEVGPPPCAVQASGSDAALALPSPQGGGAARVVLPEPVPMPRLSVHSGDGREGALFGVGSGLLPGAGKARPLLLNLWASWCAPCKGELSALRDARAALEQAGLDVLALSVDEADAQAAAGEMLAQLEWPFPAGYATPQAVEVLDALQGAVLADELRMPLPASLLIDGSGNLVALYLGAATPEQVLADLALVDATPQERRAAAVPFAGRWYQEPGEAGLATFERAFHDRGLPATAREYQPGSIHLMLASGQLQQGRLQEAERQFRRAVEAGPYFLEAYAGLAHALVRQARWDEAAQAYRAALSLAPGDERLSFGLAMCQVEAGRLDEARKLAKQLEERGSEAAPALRSRIAAAAQAAKDAAAGSDGR